MMTPEDARPSAKDGDGALAQRRHVGLYLRYPDRTGRRQAEGGRRVRGLPRTPAEGPLVSIVTVCWNAAATLEQTIGSVRDQSYGNIEHIIIDAASSDGTLALLERHAEDLEYYVSEPDKGLYFAMNKGLELAQGEHILILNADDWYTASCVEALLRAKAETGADVVSALADYVDANGTFLRLQRSFPLDEGIYLRMPLRHETMLVPAALYETLGPYDTRYFVNADRELTTRLFEAGCSHHEVPLALMSFRDTGVSSTDMEKLFGEREHMLARAFPGLSGADISALARLQTLHPDRLIRIAATYDVPRFSLAALAYARTRVGQTAAGWKDVDLAPLERLAAAAPAGAGTTPRPFSIATLSTSDHGGAGIGSMRRVEALRTRGINAEIYCLFKKTRSPHVDRMMPALPEGMRLPEPELRKAWRNAAVVDRAGIEGTTAREMISKAGTVVDFRENRQVFERADLVHLHWIVGMLDEAGIPETLGTRPVAWTLADMNAFTGGCHYSEGCTGYRDACRDCPLLGDRPEIAHETWQRKRAAYAQIPNLHVICPSQWLADRARESSLFGDRPIHVIPNAFPVDRFQATNKLVARQRLNLPLDRKLVVFGADSLDNRRKGGDILRDSIGLLKAQGRATGVEGLFFGASSLDLEIPAHSMGHVSDERKLSLIYAAADVFAFPSREDNAPLTVVEAMLSGTPVVGFPVGNVPELIEHQETGYIARYEDPEDFAEGLHWALSDPASQQALIRGLRARDQARVHNDPDTAVDRHVSLYAEMVPGREIATRSPPSPPAPLSYTIFGASLSAQRLRHDTGALVGYGEFLLRNHAEEIGSTPADIRRLTYGGNRLMDGGMVRLHEILVARPDVCIFEPLIEDTSRGRGARPEEIEAVYTLLIGAGIVPVTLLVPLPLGKALDSFPLTATLRVLCARLGLPLLEIDTAAIAATGAAFRDVHTLERSGRALARQLAAFLARLDIPALKSHCAELSLPLPALRVQTLEIPEKVTELRRVVVEVTPSSEAPYRIRLVQRQLVGPRSPVIRAEVRCQAGAPDAQDISVWDPYAHYDRKSFVTLFTDETPLRGKARIEITLSDTLPDYGSCRREKTDWPAPDSLAMRPCGPLNVVSDGPVTVQLCNYE